MNFFFFRVHYNINSFKPCQFHRKLKEKKKRENKVREGYKKGERKKRRKIKNIRGGAES